jgi:hypothetical protein
MQIGKGAILAKDMDDDLLEACKSSNQLTVEAVITTSSLEQRGPARIITFSRDVSRRNFTLGQEGDRLIFRLRTSKTDANATQRQKNLTKVSVDSPVNVIVSYFPGNLYCYINGQLAFSVGDIQGDFSNWEPCHLLFGDEHSGERDWQGKIENVAIYNRFISLEEAARKYELVMER